MKMCVLDWLCRCRQHLGVQNHPFSTPLSDFYQIIKGRYSFTCVRIVNSMNVNEFQGSRWHHWQLKLGQSIVATANISFLKAYFKIAWWEAASINSKCSFVAPHLTEWLQYPFIRTAKWRLSLSVHSDLYVHFDAIFLKMPKICHFALKVSFLTISTCIFNSLFTSNIHLDKFKFSNISSDVAFKCKAMLYLHKKHIDSIIVWYLIHSRTRSVV